MAEPRGDIRRLPLGVGASPELLLDRLSECSGCMDAPELLLDRMSECSGRMDAQELPHELVALRRRTMLFHDNESGMMRR